ncbi:MAG: hypothetical protein QXW62_06610 [Candidatus Methanomethylicaceae archaeon]
MDVEKIISIIENDLKKNERVIIDTNKINELVSNINKYNKYKLMYNIIKNYLSNKEYKVIILSKNKYLIEKRN